MKNDSSIACKIWKPVEALTNGKLFYNLNPLKIVERYKVNIVIRRHIYKGRGCI